MSLCVMAQVAGCRQVLWFLPESGWVVYQVQPDQITGCSQALWFLPESGQYVCENHKEACDLLLKLNGHSPNWQRAGSSAVERRIRAVTARVLRVAAEDVDLESRFTADLGAESIQSVELVASFEEEFGIEMDEDSALSVQTVGDAVRFVTQVCKEQGIEV